MVLEAADIVGEDLEDLLEWVWMRNDALSEEFRLRSGWVRSARC
jgi:hypothetical protein